MKQNKLTADYKAQLPHMSGLLKTSVKHWHQSQAAEDLEAFFITVLDISGNAKMHGFKAIGEVASSLQNELSPFYQRKEFPPEDIFQRITSITEQLAVLLQQPEMDHNQNIRQLSFKPKVIDHRPLHVLVIETSGSQTESLVKGIGTSGYEVSVISSPAELKANVQNNTCALVANLDQLSPEELNELTRTEEIQSSLPLIFISSNNSIGDRLKAVQAGGQAFVTAPVDYAHLLRAIDNLTGRQMQQAYRVLIIDDQKSLTDYYGEVLRNANFEVCAVNTPETELMKALSDFVPDLILLDLYMPYCNGQDLAGIIRQMDNYLSVPVVFLSAESSSDLQLRAMSTGADAFLTKPVSPDDLLLAVQSRIKRGRAVHDLMTLDALSGLYNRREVLRLLDTELARSRRIGTPLTVALLDLDHFKSINDNHGHTVGDWVIKFFSRAMQKVFRETDVIGRYGGEEFIAIFPDTETEDAHRACKRLARYIKENGHELPVNFTYSGGIALASDKEGNKSVLERADAALYKAKDMGRNKVITATDNPLK